MKKFGISYNVFDGTEHLEKSVKQVREFVDYISIVYQIISNTGEQISEENINNINKFRDNGLIDDFYIYIPDQKLSTHENEINKRNIGYFLSMNDKCDYHMTMDCDEYYLKKDFKFLIDYYNENDIDTSYCNMLTFYKENNIIIDPPEEYFVTLFNKINHGPYILNQKSDYLVDPTRKSFYTKNYKVFSRNEIQMLHLSYVRNDIKTKLINSSARINFSIENINKVINKFHNWTYPEKAFILGTTIKEYNVKLFNDLKNEIS